MDPSLFDENIAVIYDVIRSPGGLVSRRMPDRGKQIFVLVAKNIKIAAFMFKLMENYSNPYIIKCVKNKAVLENQHQ